MADWTRITSRGDVDDRRGSPLAFGGGASLLVVGLVLLVNLLGGQNVDVDSVLNQLNQASSQSTIQSKDFAGEDDYERFTATVLGSTNDTWYSIFEKSGEQYTEPHLVLFRSATQSGCGIATSDVGPHYCPRDSTIYIDETFYDVLKTKFNAKGGDVAEAYILAHEVGHHVQSQLGLTDGLGNISNEDSIKIELQADCFAGVWAHSIAALDVFEPGEISEALDAAAAVGDDRIQAKVTGQVNPETWTHGSAEQRVQWFTRGYDSGIPAQCDTFGA